MNRTTFQQKDNLRIETESRQRRFGDQPTPFDPWPAAAMLQEWHDCTVQWIHWTGKVTQQTAEPRLATGVTVRHFGKRTVELHGGTLPYAMRRRLGTPGFYVHQHGTPIITDNTTLDARKHLATPAE